jgi:hypothetical protein
LKSYVKLRFRMVPLQPKEAVLTSKPKRDSTVYRKKSFTVGVAVKKQSIDGGENELKIEEILSLIDMSGSYD